MQSISASWYKYNGYTGSLCNLQSQEMDHFAKLPGDCISEIISFTSPVDASVFSVISKRFKSESESDTVWNKFLPSDIQDVISRSSSPLEFPTKRDLYLSLSNSRILLDGGKLVIKHLFNFLCCLS